jgi:hypothetical protein
MADALARQVHGLTLDPAKLTINQYLDRWLAHIRDGKPGGLAPQHILAVHRCLHRALAQAVTWRLVARNIATDATPPLLQPTEVVALAPEQVAVLLDAAEHAPSPGLGPGRCWPPPPAPATGSCAAWNAPTWT